MKKSTILMLIVIYVAAFFVVGLVGIQLRSHYSVSFLNEIRITPFEESQLEMTQFETKTISDENAPEDEVRKQNVYTFETTTTYTADMVLKFNVNLIPDNSSVNDYLLTWNTDTNMYKITKNDDMTIFVTNIRKISRRTSIKFTVQDMQKHNITTDVTIIVK